MSTGDLADTATTLGISTTRGSDQGEWVVTVSGEVDVSASPDLRRQLVALIEGGAHSLVIDLRDTTFIDSSGLGVLVGSLRRLREEREGHVMLRHMQPSVRRVFDITGLTSLFAVED